MSDYYFTYRTANQDMPYSMQSLVVPRNSEIVVARFLRYDQTHGLPHYNADDQIIFPTKKGDIWRLPRKDPCDHYVSIIDNSTVVNIAHAYRLPEQNKGPLESYTVKGASFLIKLSPFQDKGERRQANND